MHLFYCTLCKQRLSLSAAKPKNFVAESKDSFFVYDLFLNRIFPYQDSVYFCEFFMLCSFLQGLRRRLKVPGIDHRYKQSLARTRCHNNYQILCSAFNLSAVACKAFYFSCSDLIMCLPSLLWNPQQLTKMAPISAGISIVYPS